jgi:hypothetical protein
MVFPMAFMFLLTAFSVVGTGIHYTANYSYVHSGSGSMDTTPTYDLWSLGLGAGIILTVALAAAIIMGFNLFGSGFNETSQKMTFNSILYGGIWAGLTIISSQFLFDQIMISMFWVMLTFIYVLGLGMQMQGTSGGD